MKKVIVLSTVLGLSALGMACGEAATNNTANRPANNANSVTAINTTTPAPATTPLTTTNTTTTTNSTTTTTTTGNTNTANANKPASPSTAKTP